MKHLTESEVISLYSHKMKHRDKAIVRLLLNTGLRVGELVGLRYVDAIGNSILVRPETTKTGMGREIPLNQEAKKAISALGTETIGSGLVYIGIRRIQQIMREIGEGLALPFPLTPHKFRHTFATRLIAAGISTRVVQVLLGHIALSSTQVYTAVSRDTLAEAVNRLG
jgi:integrase